LNGVVPIWGKAATASKTSLTKKNGRDAMTTWIWVVLLLCVAMIAGGLFLRSYMSGGSGGAGLFGPKAEKRLEVVEQAWVDNRRRLIIVRRDNVEHLIMTGGPVDLVIEDRIGAAVSARARPTLAVDATQPVATFGARTQRPVAAPAATAGE
jgi:flagellar protein FliO/FliZ